MSSPNKRALIVVDVQNDFCPGGALAVAQGDEVVRPLNKLIEEFLERGEPVFKSRDWHPEKTRHFSAYGGTWQAPAVAILGYARSLSPGRTATPRSGRTLPDSHLVCVPGLMGTPARTGLRWS